MYPSRWARPAALVALLALVGSVWVFASEVALEIGGLVAALLCVFVVAFSGWFVLTRRGLVRLLGTLGVLFGISGLVRTSLLSTGLCSLCSAAWRCSSSPAATRCATTRRPFVPCIAAGGG